MKAKALALGIFTCLTLSSHVHATATQIKSSKVTSDFAQTKYPIVFAHGLFGFGSVVGIDYYHQILPDLARNGASVWYTSVSPMNSDEVRGEQFVQQVEEVMAITGAERVNLIGHSQGGQSVRYGAGQLGEKVASVTTIASANQGAKLADYVLIIENTPLEHPVRYVFDKLVSPVISFAQGHKGLPHDSKASMVSLSRKGAQEFNALYPAGVPTEKCAEGAYSSTHQTENASTTYYYSFMGNKPFNTVLDPFDYVSQVASLLIGNGGDNDGIVARCDARFGKVIRDDYNWNHFDEINHLLGIKARKAPSAVDVYRQHVNRLKEQGL